MKQYLLLLRSADFNKSGDIWTSNPINLYANSQYKNYSYTRSAYGLNLIGDRTYVGTEITSPSYSGIQSTPYINTAVWKTDLGEVIYESATPTLKRFVDTTSRVDVLSYKHSFTNLPGIAIPSFFLTVYESDTESGPWLKSSVSADSNVIFIKNSKPFIKLELDIFADNVDMEAVGLIFYLEIAIHDPVSPIASAGVRSILKRFPTWTALFEDSFEQSTPSLAIPESTGGKFLTAILQESLDNFSKEVDLNDINSFINSANEDMLAWTYISYNVSQNINLITGDNIQLARVGSIADLMDGRVTDYSFYYDPTSKQLFTTKKFALLLMNVEKIDQEPINIFNDFDEFGARVSLPRLYLESNSNYKKRILDVTVNMPGVSMEAFKRTLRRELDLWRAYGATPDSNYLGATPDILEISDIENSTPYFTEDGNPTDVFRNFVEKLNEKYPSNLGFVRWEDGFWDYAGTKGEGISRVPAKYDASASPLGTYYQPGVGDFDDALVELRPLEASTVSFSGNVTIGGYKKIYTTDVYAPVVVQYSWYFNYLAQVSDYEASKAALNLVYEISLKAHGSYATPSTFYVNLNYNNRSDFLVGNKYLSTSSSSPEYNYVKILDQEGFTLPELEFRDRIYNQRYYNSSRPQSPNEISIYDASSSTVTYGKTLVSTGAGYSYVNASTPNSNTGRFSLSGSTPKWYVNPSVGSAFTFASPNINENNSNLLIGSNAYASKYDSFFTDTYTDVEVVNATNDSSYTGVSNLIIYPSDLLSPVVFKHQKATPRYLYLNASTPRNYTLYGRDYVTEAYGGYAFNPIDDETYIVPSSPNIQWQAYNKVGTALTSAAAFTSATINYTTSTPSYLQVYTVNSGHYPFKQAGYQYFKANSPVNTFSGFIDETNRTFKDQAEYENSFLLNDKFLETISLNKSSFGLAATPTYIVDYIEFVTTPNFIDAYSYDKDSVIEDMNSAFTTNSSFDVDIYARKDEVRQSQFVVGMHSGWIYLDETDQYVYVDPNTYSVNGKYFDLTLPHSPRKDSPIIVNVGNNAYRYVIFEDENNPGVPTFYNTETIIGSRGNKLYLSYEDVENITVKDSYVGKTLFENLSTSSNIVSAFDSATPVTSGREYEVVYKVRNAFYVDNDVYNSTIDDFQSKIYFSSTPSFNCDYNITYEKSAHNNFINSNLKISQTELPINEGFIYITKEDFTFSTVDAYLSSAAISDEGNDIMYLSIISYDSVGNLKPYQTFYISGTDVTADSPYVTTNDNGFAKTIIRYSGSKPAINTYGSITISGLSYNSATPVLNVNSNSGSGQYSKVIPFNIVRSINFDLKVKAVPMKYNIDADATTKVSIVGRVYWKDLPFNHAVNLKWNKARTLYSLFEGASTTSIVSAADGSFVISDAILTQNSASPGFWFARVEVSDTASTIQGLLAADGEVINASNITITGDIVYWNEKYNNLNYANEELPLPETFRFAKQANSDLYATPNFVYKHSSGTDQYRLSATPNWIPPKWVPLRKFDQYQMGLFGTTPNYISNYTNIHPDNGEE